MKYKVGDKVRVKSKEWYDENKDEHGSVKLTKDSFVDSMAKWCGKIVTIKEVFKDRYYIEEDTYCWYDDTFEDITTPEDKVKYKCKSEILFRRKIESSVWIYGVVSHVINGHVVLSGGRGLINTDYDVIPFIGNEHLVGTTDKPKEEVKTKEAEKEEVRLELKEFIVANDDYHELAQGFGVIEQFERITTKFIETNKSYCKFCVPISKFNPNDLKATEEEILTVQGGKLMKVNQ